MGGYIALRRRFSRPEQGPARADGVGTGPIAGETGPPGCGSRAGRCQQLHQHNVTRCIKKFRRKSVFRGTARETAWYLRVLAISPTSPNSSRTHPNGVALERCYMRWLVQLQDHASVLGAVGLGRHSRAALSGVDNLPPLLTRSISANGRRHRASPGFKVVTTGR